MILGMGADALQRSPTDETRVMPGRVRRVPFPPAARGRTTLTDVSYEDAFLLETRRPGDRTAEQWARLILEGAPPGLQRLLRAAWFVLGLELGPSGSEGFVFGWELRRSTPDFALLRVGSRLGASAELLLEPQEQALLWCTFGQADGLMRRAFPTLIAPVHRRAVREVLVQAGRRIGDE